MIIPGSIIYNQLIQGLSLSVLINEATSKGLEAGEDDVATPLRAS